MPNARPTVDGRTPAERDETLGQTTYPRVQDSAHQQKTQTEQLGSLGKTCRRFVPKKKPPKWVVC